MLPILPAPGICASAHDMTGRRLYCTPCITSLPDRTIARVTRRKETAATPRVETLASLLPRLPTKVDAALDRGAGDAEHAEEKVSPPLFADLFSRVRVPFPSFVFLIPTLIYASRLLALIPLLNSGSLPHRLGRGSRILSRHKREREEMRDTPSWVAGPRVGAGGGVVATATVGV
jgi:hypothetical protein